MFEVCVAAVVQASSPSPLDSVSVVGVVVAAVGSGSC